ncbi:MAG TPA: ring-cleaving dioxygenase [Ktedonobacterales bacterium]|nr:ring-cleaving dioxygenase [Ktedonobacterales bacterium]
MHGTIPGIHHVTAITGDAQRNLDFYSGLLGLRLVKLTVNFDDPGSYHFYYGDALGTPGSILTFFAWPGAPRGRHGTGQTGATGFSIPRESLGYWLERLVQRGIEHEGPETRFGEKVVLFKDFDGLPLELVASNEAKERPLWQAGPVPAEHAIRGFSGVTLWEDGTARTAKLLTAMMGFHEVAKEGSVTRFATGEGGPSTYVDLRDATGFWRGSVAAGTVHHVAYRTPTDADQLNWLEELTREGLRVTPVQDRQYFHSIYFREPGGVLFEIATDLPGFATDETPEQLGTGLRLPPWFESQRAEIEQVLPPVKLPTEQQEARA